jgi:3-oxoacyl-[acyl-carrier-protein] synthase II
VDRKAGYPPFDAASEKPFEGLPQSVLATAVGYHYFEGIALVAAD